VDAYHPKLMASRTIVPARLSSKFFGSWSLRAPKVQTSQGRIIREANLTNGPFRNPGCHRCFIFPRDSGRSLGQSEHSQEIFHAIVRTPYFRAWLRVAYGANEVLKGIDLSITRGSFVALLGPSGCGKTTLLRTLSGFNPASAGSISVNGRNIAQEPPERRNMAMVFQSYALWSHMNVAQNIGYGLKLRKLPRTDIQRRIDVLLDMLGLQGFGERAVTELSGGQRQRVALGRALAVEPQILLLDEPLSNLDARIRLQMRHEIRTIQRQLGVTAILVTHDREEAMVMADQVVILNQGQVAQIGTPEEVFQRPKRLT